MNELIEKLKDKDYVRVFGLMKPKEQECLKKVGKTNSLWFSGANWHNCADPFTWGRAATYRIRPDYQPEPEYEDKEITRQGNWLGITRPWAGDYSRFPFDFTHLHCLPNLPNFRYFWYVNLAVGTEARTHFAHVSRKISEGHTVYARFRV